MTELKVVSAFHHFTAKDSNFATKIHNCFVNVAETIRTCTVKICRRILLTCMPKINIIAVVTSELLQRK